MPNAKIAQLVEHNLAKVGVAGSSPVFRSKENIKISSVAQTQLCWLHAKIAQLVEHNLAKVGVAGSSPVFRSNHYHLHQSAILADRFCPGGGIGRHATLRG